VQPASASRAGQIRPPANVQFTSSVAKQPEKPETRAETPAPKATLASGWVIQLGATDDEGKAKGIISDARARSRTLAEAKGFTQPVERGGSTLFRARFAGFDPCAVDEHFQSGVGGHGRAPGFDSTLRELEILLR
jgi:D-alanyl-D-alanine carboxypeptidase